MEAGNRHCMGCRLRLAELFCTCTEQEIFLCGACFLDHSQKKSRKGHHTWPVSELFSYKDPHFFDRQEAFPAVQAQAREGVAEVERAIGEYRALANKIIKEIRTSVQRTIEELTGIKAQLSVNVEDGLEEVGRTLSDQQPLLRSKYGPVFRALLEIPNPFQLFVFTPPACSVSPQSLLSFQYHLRLPEDFIAESKPVPTRPYQPTQTYFDAKPEPPQVYFDAKLETPQIAEAHYQESIRICAAHFPQSFEFAKCLLNCGKLYMDMGQLEQAERQLLDSCQLLQSYFSGYIEFAECHGVLGDLYNKMKGLRQSEESYLRAIPLFRASYPDSWQFADCMRKLGFLYKDMKRYEQSEAQYLRAISVYAAYFPQSITFAVCLYFLGDLYMEMKRYEESEDYYLRAVSLFDSRYPQDINYAYCLYFFGLLYETTGRKADAVERLQAAMQVFGMNNDQKNVSDCRAVLRRLRNY